MNFFCVSGGNFKKFMLHAIEKSLNYCKVFFFKSCLSLAIVANPCFSAARKKKWSHFDLRS